MANKKKNHINIDGRIGKDPEIRQVGNYTIAEFDICHNNSKKVGGEWVNDPMWVGITYFMHESDDRYKFAKGALVEITGSLKCDSWTSSDGQKRTKFKISASELLFIETDNRQSISQSSNQQTGFDDDFEDDIPF